MGLDLEVPEHHHLTLSQIDAFHDIHVNSASIIYDFLEQLFQFLNGALLVASILTKIDAVV